MYYDDAKGRYVIEGESESDDEPIAPPPPVRPKPPAEEDTNEEGKKEPKTGVESLLAPPSNPSMARRGQRPRRGPQFASALGANISDMKYIPAPSQEPVVEESKAPS